MSTHCNVISGLDAFDDTGSELTGWKLKINFKKLGKTLNTLRKNPLVKGAVFAAAGALGGPAGMAAAQALGMSPLTIRGAMSGAAALAVSKKAAAGDPTAKRVVEQALAAANAPGNSRDTAVFDGGDVVSDAATARCGCRFCEAARLVMK